MKHEDSINTIYQYTENHVEAQEDSLNRLDAKSSAFIGFSTILIRLAVDLPSNSNLTKVLVCFFAIISILISAAGLTARMTGKVTHPETLLSNYLDADELVHQYIIIKNRISLIDEYESLTKKKQYRTNIMILFFCLSIFCYALGVSGVDSCLYKAFMFLFP
jgi:hypothetical protein